jgi:prepilin-type N-terminal cleavage/methylation domain-containing protein
MNCLPLTSCESATCRSRREKVLKALEVDPAQARCSGTGILPVRFESHRLEARATTTRFLAATPDHRPWDSPHLGSYRVLNASLPRGFTLTELLVVLAAVLVLALLLLPALATAKKKSSRINCINNVKQVATGFRLWAGDNGGLYPMAVSVTNGGTLEPVASGVVFPHFQVMSNELNTPKIVVCPNDVGRVIATNFTTDFADSRISYFVGVDTLSANPQMVLTGDRNLTLNGLVGLRGLVSLPTNAPVAWLGTNLHRTRGNVALGDGSAQGVTTTGLRQLLAGSGTNRLAIP